MNFKDTKIISGPSGNLEVRCSVPDARARGLSIICHPHPVHGGTMQNKVVTTLERTMRELDAITVCFNFRGVGASEGAFADGVGELDDLRAVYTFARGFFPDLPLWLAGFSFGSFISTSLCSELKAQRLISIAPPVVSWDFSHAQVACPWLIVQGDADEVVSAQAVYAFAEARHAQLEVLPATHFFHGKLLELRASVQAWMSA
jgi:uncharacterized protein